MSQYYINAESIIQDGTTPATGYHNFSDLTAAHVLTSSDFVDVVKTTTIVTETQTNQILLAGTIRSQVFGQFPIIMCYPLAPQPSGDTFHYGMFSLKSNTFIKGLLFRADMGNLENKSIQLFGTPFTPTTPVSDIVFDSCIFQNINVTASHNYHSKLFAAGGSIGTTSTECRSITFKNCTMYNFNRLIRMTIDAPDPANKLVFVNNSVTSNMYPGEPVIFGSNLEIQYFNNVVKLANGKILNITSASGLADYNVITSTSPVGSAYGSIPIGSNNYYVPLTTATFSADYWPGTNTDFTIGASSYLVDKGINNAYTPSVDILGGTRSLPYDIGAYEYSIPCTVTVDPASVDSAAENVTIVTEAVIFATVATLVAQAEAVSLSTSSVVSAGATPLVANAETVSLSIGAVVSAGSSLFSGITEPATVVISNSIIVSSSFFKLYVSPYFTVHSGGIVNWDEEDDMPTEWLRKCDGQNYENERELYRGMITEAYNKFGVCMTYYIASYDTKYDKIWGEDENRRYVRKFEMMAFYPLQSEEKMWTKFAIEGIDNFSVFVSKDHFRVACTYGHDMVKGNIGENTYPIYVPKTGDVIQSMFNKYLYEVITVKEEAMMIHLNKRYVWELVVRPFSEEHLSLDSDTSASMGTLSAYMNVKPDKLDVSNVAISAAEKLAYTPKSCELPPRDPWGGW